MRFIFGITFFLAVIFYGFEPSYAQDTTQLLGEEQSSGLIRTAILLTLLAIIPALFISMTCFIRIAIVLSMVRHAFGMPETPPNQVLVTLAFFLTLFVMTPTLTEVNDLAVQPFIQGEVTLETAMEQGSEPLREFMLRHTRDKDLQTMYSISGQPLPQTPSDVNMLILTPAFILNELRVSFTIGFVILLPFLLIDLVVSSILLSLGMMMVPPSTISLPIKLLMFVVIDGWALVIQGVLGGFG
ncbi:flagellar type III secretion system pore protein FliP [Fretibacter rubidus]|uniref:flagellar type III secretion system pore protein FliP n=1 Tax=Fretibacter rubidus TaxID=570162 RepID=UPI00352BC6B9